MLHGHNQQSECHGLLLMQTVLCIDKLERAVRAEGSVETWLTSLLQTSQQSLHAIIRQAFIMINDLSFNLLLFLDKVPAQVSA